YVWFRDLGRKGQFVAEMKTHGGRASGTGLHIVTIDPARVITKNPQPMDITRQRPLRDHLGLNRGATPDESRLETNRCTFAGKPCWPDCFRSAQISGTPKIDPAEMLSGVKA